jgi:hypothetical protein
VVRPPVPPPDAALQVEETHVEEEPDEVLDRGLQVEETHVEEEPDDVLDHGPNLAHRHRWCDLFIHIVV